MQAYQLDWCFASAKKEPVPKVVHRGPARKQENKQTRLQHSSSVLGTYATCRAWPSVLAPWILYPVGGFELHGALKLVSDLVWASLSMLAPRIYNSEGGLNRRLRLSW